ncbi:hypothetical protein REPUB_Repub09cG0060600 [Reevesia pubescens]
MGKAKTVAETSMIRLTKILEKFREAEDEVYTFEANLSNKERAVVHKVCQKMGMKSKSKGRGDQRRVSVYKIKGKINNMAGKESLTNVTFSEGSKVVLQDLFTNHPPDDGELEEKVIGKYSGKTAKIRRKKDDIFFKPLMSNADVAEKVKTLASRREKDPNLRQINEETSKLPIASFRDAITSTVESNQVVLISGETGCGKTTQVPQFLLDYLWEKGEACKILCTQPRRISATSVSERIAYERGQYVGDDVGYKIRLESKGGRHSSIVFCTNGVLLRVLVANGRSKKEDISDMTHIIMDEVHERDCFCDFMLAIIRDILPSYPHLRLVLMSATLDAERFSRYFGGCPIIRVPGFTYPVKAFYLEDVLSILKSANNSHLISANASVPDEDPELTEEDNALDEAIDLAWSSDEFDPLLDLVCVEGGSKVHNYQHSLTGLTPLMVFAGKGRVDDVCMLLSFGVNCHLISKDGNRALEWAEQENQQEAAEIIKKHMQSLRYDFGGQQLLDKYISAVDPEIIDVVLIEQLLRKICSDSNEGAILVFLPGWEDINRTKERLLANPFFKDSSRFVIIPLHSMVPSVEQKKVFKRPPLGCRKIVLSTNIAESSITIDDVVYVIDSGRMKEKSYDPYNNVSTLQSSWISKANAKQREGRAGRCQPGICYHLFSKLRAASMPDFQVPEIKRMPIEELCLQVKLLDPNCKVEDFLQKTLDPPVSETVRNAVSVLQDIGAFSHDEELTELGEKLGYLPVHPLTSKMLFFAILMNCLDPALTLACASDFRDPFVLPMRPNEKEKAAAARHELASLYGGQSDQLAVIAAFECWKNAKQRGLEGRFCSQYFISSSTMNMLLGMCKQLQAELLRYGFIPDDVSSCSLNANHPGILHAVLVAGLYPMVGRMLPEKQGKRFFIEAAAGGKVRLHSESINSKLSLTQSNGFPLVIYDEITCGDGGMFIRNCTVVGPLPLLLLATDIAVAPAKGNDDNDDDGDGSDDGDACDTDGDEVLVSKSGGNEEKVMSSPDNSVIVVVDRWLSFRSTALDVAQIYCLRERLSAAILFKVMHPRQVLPPVLWASMYAIACILSYDGLSGISTQAESVDSLTLRVRATDINKPMPGRRGMGPNPSRFILSLVNQSPFDTSNYQKAKTPAVEAVTNGIEPSSCNQQAPAMSVGTSLNQASSKGPISVASGSGVSKLQGPRRESCKRRRWKRSKSKDSKQ